MGVIYCIKNKQTNDFYIGQTSKYLSTRVSEHWWHAERNTSNNKFYNALMFYGKQNFIVSVLEEVEDSSLNAREIYWINQLRPAYNCSIGGDVHTRGMSYEDIYGASKAADLKASRTASNKARGPRSDATKAKISATRNQRLASGKIIPNVPPIDMDRIHRNLVKMREVRECPHCGKSTNVGNYSRWHGDNCRSLQNEIHFSDTI